MAKHQGKKKVDPPLRTGHIQFRPPRMLQDQLAYLARAWSVSANEAAKEICLLSSVGLGICHRKLARTLARALGDEEDLNRACEWFHVAMMERKPSWDTQDLLREVDDGPAAIFADLIREVEERNRGAKETGP